jgi:hypothetical protein
MTEKTKVVFRVWPEGDILALFPEEPGDVLGHQCLSYQRIGQHGNADYDHCISATRPAQPDEYAGLAEELRRIGYDLDVCKRASSLSRCLRMQRVRVQRALSVCE